MNDLALYTYVLYLYLLKIDLFPGLATVTNLVSAVDSNFGSLELTRTYGAKKNNRRQFALNSQSVRVQMKEEEEKGFLSLMRGPTIMMMIFDQRGKRTSGRSLFRLYFLSIPLPPC